MQSEESTSRFKGRILLASSEVTMFLLLVIFLLPYMITYRGYGSDVITEVKALTWEFAIYSDGTLNLFASLDNMINLPFIGFKYLLLFLFYRYYKGLTTMKRVLIVGILSELQGFIFFGTGHIIAAIIGTISWAEVFWRIPTPFAFVTCIILLILVPRSESKITWIEKVEENSWWTQKSN